MNSRGAFFAGAGCMLLVLVCAVTAIFGIAIYQGIALPAQAGVPSIPNLEQIEPPQPPEQAPDAAPTFTPAPAQPSTRSEEDTETASQQAATDSQQLIQLYQQLTPGVVNVQVTREQAGQLGQGAGSGFILNDEGHIVTNNHVVADAQRVTVVFYNGLQAEAAVIGTDADSDLAVVQVDELAEGAHPLALGESDAVQAGQRVVAIGNPFGLEGSISEGIVSAVGRTIPSGLTPFSIPQAIQTDAAINPGNSGGPLLNMQGEVIGVNAQIRTSGNVRANTGVGFAIPSSVVRLVVPSLIENGEYAWPWLGVSGTSVNLTIQDANNLNTQRGAYLVRVVDGSPADEAGLQGAEIREQDGLQIPVGGDVVVAANGEDITSFADLLNMVAFSRPSEEIELTILRDGQRQTVTVELTRRPEELEPDTQQMP